MAEVENIPVASITSLETLARIDESSKTKVTLIDARNNQVYCGIFNENYQLKQEMLADDISKIIEILKQYDNIICLGNGAVLHQDLILQNLPQVEFSEKNAQSAGFGGKIAYQKYLKNDLQSADTILPMYLRKSQAERLKEK